MTALRTLLAVTDLSAPATRAVERAFQLARRRHAALTVLHALDLSAIERLQVWEGVDGTPLAQRLLDAAQEALTREVHGLSAKWGVSAQAVVAAGAVLPTISTQADRLDADLLLAGARGEGVFGRLLVGTTVERLLRRTHRPLLVVRREVTGPYAHVLVPVDFSPWSAAALALARAVAPGATLTVLHAFEAPFESRLRYAGVDEAQIDAYLATARDDALRELRTLARAAQRNAEAAPGDAQGFTIDCAVKHGAPGTVIEAEAERLDCDLIVLGKHGRGVLEDMLLGSVTKHVLAEAGCDVLVATTPETGSPTPP
jgi:nucleotide-binding universal stress UspA family protein